MLEEAKKELKHVEKREGQSIGTALGSAQWWQNIYFGPCIVVCSIMTSM